MGPSELAAGALATGQNRLECLRIEADVAAYTGLSGEISLDLRAMPVRAADPAFAGMLRYLGSGVATVPVIGARSVAGYAVARADRVAGQPAVHTCRRQPSPTHGACRDAVTRSPGHCCVGRSRTGRD
jgi:hypothetical protein